MSSIIYLHGYGSTPNSDKVLALREYFTVFASSIPIKFDDGYKILKEFILTKPDAILVGTSLGGYWATIMSDVLLLPAVLINPSCSPKNTLHKYNNPELTEVELKKYIPLAPKNNIPRIVLLAKDDDILDYRIAEKLFESKAKVNIYENGGHRFNYINRITDAITELENESFYLP